MRNYEDFIIELLSWLLIATLIVSVLFMCTSCASTRVKTKEVVKEVPVVERIEVHDTIRDTRIIHTSDTVHITDSIAPNSQGGIDRWHSVCRSSASKEKADKEKRVNESTDTPVPVSTTTTEYVEVEKSLSLWQRLQNGIGWLVAGIIIALVMSIMMRRK